MHSTNPEIQKTIHHNGKYISTLLTFFLLHPVIYPFHCNSDFFFFFIPWSVLSKSN